MGRGFKGATSSTASSVKDGGGSTAGRATDDTSCGLCKQEVAVQEEEHIVGLCTCCGSVPYHIPCVQDHLERTLRCQIREGGYNTKAWEKVQQKIKQRPWTLFSQNGGAQKLKVQCPACQEGFVDSADVEKPVRKLPAPLPAPATRQRGQPAPTSAAKRPSAPAPAPRPMAKPKLTQQQQIQQQLAVARRELGSGKGAAPNHVSGQPRQGGASSGGVASVRARQHATGRPPWLQMCPEVVDGGECYMYSCEHCHSKAEQAEREQEWQEEQAAKRREERQQELEEHKRQLEADAAATAAAAGEAAARRREHQAQLRRDLLAREEAAMPLSDDALTLMKRHKRRACISALTDMGFDRQAAETAAEACGCEPSAAAALLAEGEGSSGGSGPPSVVREALELLAAAQKLGASPAAVEAALVAAAGDWEQAGWDLRQQARIEGEARATATLESFDSVCVLAAQPKPTTEAEAQPARPAACSAYGPASQPPAWQPLKLAAAESDGASAIPAWRPGSADASSASTPAASLLADGCEKPAPVAAVPPVPHPAQGYDAGFAAGIAAALKAAAPPQEPLAAALSAWAAPAAPPQPPLAPAEEEIDDLMQMLGIA